MYLYLNRLNRRTFAMIGLASALIACSDDGITNNPPAASRFTVTKFVADNNSGGAAAVDANLVNAWGLAFGPTGILWVANQGTGTSTLYDVNGAAQSLVVTIPTSGAATGGEPTGTIFNSTSDFGGAKFIFAGEDGVITAWTTGTKAQVVADRSSQDAVYKGIAMASSGGANFLYATNFKHNTIDVFDATFQFVKSFTDPGVPSGYAPFGIQNINGKLYVTFAKQKAPQNEDDDPGVGNGFVDVFNPDGTMSSRFASNGKLNSPWAIALAPTGFGTFSGDILVGNFGDGQIGAYDPVSGAFIDFLRTDSGDPISINGLWGLAVGPAAQPSTLFFSAGPNNEANGLLGAINVK